MASYIGKYQVPEIVLPNGYMQVEYLESTGTQYIKTGFNPNQNTRVRCDLTCPPIGGNWMFGSRKSGGDSQFGFVYSTGGYYLAAYNTVQTSFSTSMNSENRIFVDANKQTTTLTSNGTTTSVTGTTGTFTSPVEMILFGCSTNGTISYGKGKIYSCEIYDNGNLIRNYIPCLNASGVAGLYDLVNNKFYNNAGTGTFATGGTIKPKVEGYVAHRIKKGYIGAKKELSAYRGLPNGYTQVEYIQSSGTQHINTGFIPNNNSRIIMTAKYMATPTGNAALFGSRNSNNNEFWAYYRQADAKFCLRYASGGSSDKLVAGTPTAKNVVDMNKNVLSVGGNSISATAATYSCDYTAYIFACNNANTASLPSAMQLYDCKIYDNGTLVRDYVPCINTSNEVGLYDMVEGKFYGNVGSGAFATGNIVESVIKEVANKIKKGYIGTINPAYRNLPSGYKQVEYIESNGTQYIDTGFKPNQNTKVTIDFEVTALPSGYGALLSARNDTSGNGAFSLWINASVPCFLWQYNTGAGKSTSKDSPSVVGNRIIAENTANVMNVGGANLTESAATFNGNYALYLLATNDPDTNRYCCSAKIYSCKIYDNGNLIRNFVPCKNPSGVAGLYDLANGVFYANAGTGTFAVGTEITGSPVARLFFGGIDVATMLVSYSGNHTDEVVTMGDGKQYRLLTLTSTGTLTLEEEVQADVWVCGGGSTAGTHGNNTNLKVRGGNGSNFLQTTMKLQEAVVVVGSGNGGVTSVNNGSVEIKNNASGSITGGGGGMYSTGTLGNPAGTGGAKAGGDTRPFKDSYFTKYPCAGGAGGNYYYASDAGYASSGQGGEGGSSLRAGNKGGYDPSIAPAGGETGGGKGGTATARHTYSSGGSASYYGSGGGGGGYTSGTTSGSSGGNGYQGVCYIRIPLE